jgi:hypothetical protein
MSLRRFAFAVGFLVICCLLFSQSRATSETASAIPVGYQLLPAQVSLHGPGNNWDEHRVYLLDSASGRIWELMPEYVGKDGKYHEATFRSVPVKE